MNQIIAASGTPKLALGELIIPEDVEEKIDPAALFSALVRHSNCQWTDAELSRNENALLLGHAILTQHTDSQGASFYLLTNAERSNTTIVFVSPSA